ncbi:hypothetical protein [Halovibrio salipaludis]|nr:hypothetical protein [Halovibrio salipaludis]
MSLTIQGSGFTTKSQEATVFYDHADIAWENGVKNEHQSSFDDMELIKRPNEDPETIWGKPSLPPSDDKFNTGMRITKQRPGRTVFSQAHYYAKGNNNFLGWPTVIGGTDVNRESRKTYISYWFKMPFDLANYYAIPGDENSDQFKSNGSEEYGESIEIEGVSGQGKLISYESNLGDVPHGWIFFEPPENVTRNDEMKGKTITGVNTGTQVRFPDSPSLGKFDDNGYLNPRGKYLRFWSDNDGYRYSLGNVGLAGTGESIWLNEFDSKLPDPGRWNKFEIEVSKPDYKNNKDPEMRIFLNDEPYMIGDKEWQESVIDEGISDPKAISIALLGINDFMPVPFTTEIDDIYMDLDFNRVLLCSARTIQSVRDGKGNCEPQLIKSWSANQIEIQTYLGVLQSEAGVVYAYVFDSEGNPNSDGYAIEISSLPSEPKNFEVQ